MHSALGYMGARGLQDVQLSMITNAVLYCTFFVMGCFSGSTSVSVIASRKLASPKYGLHAHAASCRIFSVPA